jgi:hypothetical protein
MELSGQEKEEYTFLKQRVDYCQDQVYRRDAPKDAHQKLWQAREDLRAFVEERRKNGARI